MRSKGKPAWQLRSRSDAVVYALMKERPTIKRVHMGEEIRRRWPDLEDLHDSARSIVPDAYEFHDDLSTLTIIEVVDTNPIRPFKARKIVDLTFALQGMDWELTVAVFNASGQYLGEVPGGFFYGVEPRHDTFPEALSAFVQVLIE